MERFTRGERTVLAAVVALAVAAGVFVWANFTRAFPEASLEFEVNRSTSRPVGEEFLRRHAPQAAEHLDASRRAAVFELDDDAKVYLERELGLENLGGLIARREVRLWSWSHRWFRALQKEEVRVAVSPEGEVIGFAHLLPEEATGASLEEEPARSIAERLFADGFSLDAGVLRFIESKREDRPARRDWTFTWEREGWRQGEATYRFQVEVHGDQPGAYREFLKVPDAWTQSYQRLRAANNTTAQVAGFGLLLTGLAAVVVMFVQARRGNVRWRVAVLLALVSFALFFLLGLNNLPLALYGFDTTGSFGSFLAGQVLFALAGAGLQALPILILVAAGEALYRTRFPQHLRVAAVLAPAGWRGKRFAFGLVLGYALAVLFIAYQVAFYLLGKRFGAWNPADVPFSNLLNTAFPWLAVLFIGFYPAVSEEFLSRLFSIPLVEGLTKSRIAAVVIPALLWGFAHANYPAQPFFIRGVEVSIAGLAAGILLYRFGVVPCLVWHYVVDAGYTSLLLVRSGNPYFVATAIVGTGALLVPLLVALVGAWRRGGFVDEQASLNAADPPPPVPEAAPVEVAASPLSAVPARRAAAVAVPLLIVGALLAVRAPNLSREVAVELRPSAARAAAETFLRERGEDPAKWRFVVTANSDPLGATARRYLVEQGGLEAVRRLVVEVPPWQVRAFRPEEREEWRFGVDDPSARVVRFEHVLREEAEGAALPVDEARALAERHLAGVGLDAAAFEFKEGRSEQRPARLDHEFTWKDPTRSVGEAEYLVTVSVQGDRVDGEQRRLKLPEAWERARERRPCCATACSPSRSA
jgi:membrane protease YdiL (CAAX protease family)